MLTCADVTTLNCYDSNDNCGTHFSYVYFASFVFLCSYIMTNLFLAVIMDNFVYLTHDISTLDSRHIHGFTAMWNKYDKKGTGSIPADDMVDFLRKLQPPLGFGILCPSRTIYGKLLKLQVPIEEDNRVKFNELLLTLVVDCLNIRTPRGLIRDDIQLLVPDIDQLLLDRVIPVDYDPRILNEAEKCYYKDCASTVITGYYKMYRSGLRNINEKRAQGVMKTILKCSASCITQNQRSNSDMKLDNRKYLDVLKHGNRTL